MLVNQNGYATMELRYWDERREFSKFEAWFYIQVKENFKTSIRILAKEWLWTERKVRTFIDSLKKEGVIAIEKTDSIIITVIQNSLTLTSDTPNDTLSHRSSQRFKGKSDTPNDTLSHKKKAKEKSFIQKVKDIFDERYLELYNSPYYWQAKDVNNLKQLIDKIKFARKGRNLEIDDESILEAFPLFLNAITDKWTLENYSMPVINSKYNDIVTKAKKVGTILKDNSESKYKNDSKKWQR